MALSRKSYSLLSARLTKVNVRQGSHFSKKLSPFLYKIIAPPTFTMLKIFSEHRVCAFMLVPFRFLILEIPEINEIPHRVFTATLHSVRLTRSVHASAHVN